jgi:hypothetical protein
MRTFTCSVVFAAVIALPAAAQDGLVATDKGGAEAEAEVIIDDRASPPEQEELFSRFAATWRCTGTSSTEFGAEVPTTLTISGKKDLGGRWLVVKTELVPKAKGAKGTSWLETWGYSRAAGALVRQGASSDGGLVQSTSTGWGGEFFNWVGTSAQHGKAVKEKLSFEKKSDKELAVLLSMGADELRVIFEGTCKR